MQKQEGDHDIPTELESCLTLDQAKLTKFQLWIILGQKNSFLTTKNKDH